MSDENDVVQFPAATEEAPTIEAVFVYDEVTLSPEELEALLNGATATIAFGGES